MRTKRIKKKIYIISYTKIFLKIFKLIKKEDLELNNN